MLPYRMDHASRAVTPRASSRSIAKVMTCLDRCFRLVHVAPRVPARTRGGSMAGLCSRPNCLPFLSRGGRMHETVGGGVGIPEPACMETPACHQPSNETPGRSYDAASLEPDYPMNLDEAASWLVNIGQPTQERAYRLVMLPWVGADPKALQEAWQEMHGWSEDTEAVAVQLPGRGTRRSERPMQDVREIAALIAEAMDIAGYLRSTAPPLLLWGHSSFGSMLAVHTAYWLQRREAETARKLKLHRTRDSSVLSHVIVSGAPPIHDLDPAPSAVLSALMEGGETELLRRFLATRGRRGHSSRKPSELPSLSREQLWMRVLEVTGNGVSRGPLLGLPPPAATREREGWLLEAIRADMLAVETYMCSTVPVRLHCPLLALCGTRDDPSLQRSMHHWRASAPNFNFNFNFSFNSSFNSNSSSSFHSSFSTLHSTSNFNSNFNFNFNCNPSSSSPPPPTLSLSTSSSSLRSRSSSFSSTSSSTSSSNFNCNFNCHVSFNEDEAAQMMGGEDGFVVGGYAGRHFWEGEGGREMGLVMRSVIVEGGAKGEQGEEQEEQGEAWEQMEVAEGMAVLETGAAEEEGGRKAEAVGVYAVLREWAAHVGWIRV